LKLQTSLSAGPPSRRPLRDQHRRNEIVGIVNPTALKIVDRQGVGGLAAETGRLTFDGIDCSRS
jgi:hypothetical protein